MSAHEFVTIGLAFSQNQFVFWKCLCGFCLSAFCLVPANLLEMTHETIASACYLERLTQ